MAHNFPATATSRDAQFVQLCTEFRDATAAQAELKKKANDIDNKIRDEESKLTSLRKKLAEFVGRMATEKVAVVDDSVVMVQYEESDKINSPRVSVSMITITRA